MRASAYLLNDMPRRVLFGRAPEIEAWCRENGRQRPTLLDLTLARQAVQAKKKETPRVQ